MKDMKSMEKHGWMIAQGRQKEEGGRGCWGTESEREKGVSRGGKNVRKE